MGRANNRTGYSKNRGAINPPIHVGSEFPDSPILNHIFLDTTTLRLYYYDGTNWILFGGTVVTWTAGENLYRGEIVYISQSDGLIYKNPINGDMPVGAVFADCTTGNTVYIITSGMAYVLPVSSTTITQGYVLYSSGTTAGRVDSAATVPAATTHFREVGHALETSSANGALTRAIIHFN